jgi:hypothetical protein
MNIQNISKEELLSFYDLYIHPSSPHRSVLSVHVQSRVEPQPTDLSQQLDESAGAFGANGVSHGKRRVLRELMMNDICKVRSMLKPGEKPQPVEPLETFL